MWRQVTSPTLLAANPKCNIDVNMSKDLPPSVDMTFIDGTTITMDAVVNRPANLLISDMYQGAHSISLDYAIQKKPPPG